MIALALPLLLALMSPSDYDGHTWHWSGRPALKAVWVASGNAVYEVCGMDKIACARFGSVCFIYAQKEEEDTPAWIVKHEKRHCAGEDHE